MLSIAHKENKNSLSSPFEMNTFKVDCWRRHS